MIEDSFDARTLANIRLVAISVAPAFEQLLHLSFTQAGADLFA
jgi:hypothetical protein